MTNRELKSYYRRYNKKYFGNSLPDILVCFGKVSSGLAAAFLTFDDGSHAIHIHPLLQRFKLSKYVLMLLIHEMVHVDLRDHKNHKTRCGHGKIFEDRMRQLASAGAFKGLW